MRQHKPAASVVFRTMKKSANWRTERCIMKCLDVAGGRSHCGSGQLNLFQPFKTL